QSPIRNRKSRITDHCYLSLISSDVTECAGKTYSNDGATFVIASDVSVTSPGPPRSNRPPGSAEACGGILEPATSLGRVPVLASIAVPFSTHALPERDGLKPRSVIRPVIGLSKCLLTARMYKVFPSALRLATTSRYGTLVTRSTHPTVRLSCVGARVVDETSRSPKCVVNNSNARYGAVAT